MQLRDWLCSLHLLISLHWSRWFDRLNKNYFIDWIYIRPIILHELLSSYSTEWDTKTIMNVEWSFRISALEQIMTKPIIMTWCTHGRYDTRIQNFWREHLKGRDNWENHATQFILTILKKPNIRIFLSQINPIHIIKTQFLRCILIVSSHL